MRERDLEYYLTWPDLMAKVPNTPEAVKAEYGFSDDELTYWLERENEAGERKGS